MFGWWLFATPLNKYESIGMMTFQPNIHGKIEFMATIHHQPVRLGSRDGSFLAWLLGESSNRSQVVFWRHARPVAFCRLAVAIWNRPLQWDTGYLNYAIDMNLVSSCPPISWLINMLYSGYKGLNLVSFHVPHIFGFSHGPSMIPSESRLIVGRGLVMSHRVIVAVGFVKDKAIGIVLGFNHLVLTTWF